MKGRNVKFTWKNISITMNNGLHQIVRALCKDKYGIHKRSPDVNVYVVTHIPTGLEVRTFSYITHARLFVDKLIALDLPELRDRESALNADYYGSSDVYGIIRRLSNEVEHVER